HVRLIEPDESAEPGSLAHRRAEIHVAGALLLHVEDDVHVTLFTARLRFRSGYRLLEEIQIADVLVAPNQEIAVEHLPRSKHDLLANARFRRVAVARDLDPVDDCRRALGDLLAEIHPAHGVGSRL